MIDRSALSARIKEIRGKRTLSQFADIIGVSHMSVKRYEEGALPDIDTLLNIAKAGDIDLGRLLTGKPLPADVRDVKPLTLGVLPAKSYSATDNGEWPALSGDQYISVPLTKSAIAAGEPIIMEEDVIDHVLLHMRALKKAGASKNLVACRVKGDSMSPHLNSGDIVVIDRDVDKEKIIEKKIYAVMNDGGVTAKTLQKEGYHLYLIPLNQSHRIQHIDLREVDNSPIVGLVIGAWRNFEGRLF
ncbi:hypothetical protein MNBD_NITROSPINAE01-1465 [hydrothermal vent metagenome]|uniref:HTH cro/C1-type domain-containing protein n=1 Tax=hydrothermal vent metagenome TaxID=652676 RepID=A0A3B1BSB5_9ZZZZ